MNRFLIAGPANCKEESPINDNMHCIVEIEKTAPRDEFPRCSWSSEPTCIRPEPKYRESFVVFRTYDLTFLRCRTCRDANQGYRNLRRRSTSYIYVARDVYWGHPKNLFDFTMRYLGNNHWFAPEHMIVIEYSKVLISHCLYSLTLWLNNRTQHGRTQSRHTCKQSRASIFSGTRHKSPQMSRLVRLPRDL